MTGSIEVQDNRCTFTYADGRRCRMLRMEGHDSLCPHHWARGEEHAEADRAAAQLVPRLQDLTDKQSLQEVLARMFQLVAQGRLSPQRAMPLAYIGQLLLQTQALHIRYEVAMSQMWEPTLKRIHEKDMARRKAAR